MSQTTNNMEQIVEKVEEQIQPVLKEIQKKVRFNQKKVLDGFRKCNVSDFHFTPSTGYGYGDSGRDTLEELYAEVFQGEAALVRPQIISGTHAIATALLGVLRPGDDLLYITGQPYDTLLDIVGVTGNGIGSLKEFQIGYHHVDLLEDGRVDFDEVKANLSERTKVIGIQRSRGYANRPSFTISDIEEMIATIKPLVPNAIFFVDNCYGEFVETREPLEVGADLIAGSLIKNPGGGIVKMGGYIVGSEELIEKCAYRLTTPGIGREAGATLYSLLEMYQGLFLAPHVVGEAVKGAVYTAALLEHFQVESTPRWDDPRTDLIQMVALPSKDEMIAFAQTIQKYSPIDSSVLPIPAPMPGYDDDVIMAAGTFIQGASIELSADGPIRPPYLLYIQGGLTYEHVQLAVTAAVEETFM
ncbi:aminotransferase class I/II-fold pyridoxal phosphate-dependent enzyme [Jeotgalibaca caeni]|uniref:methionine gamma-lyase family protein n=1 Tax=Jeotgalibaca caeni TaxID=3028623 RepID=UPI00237E582A|nr:methionine gamma-lyase family protein [Jeotgalibaca caeni]MDE1547854.1 methionine gamma-lyase family protein [Jeotgalibaca caeni]